MPSDINIPVMRNFYGQWRVAISNGIVRMRTDMWADVLRRVKDKLSLGGSRFGFIGSPLPCLNACAAQGANNVLATPNYNAEADGMASIIAHEIMEVSTDPLINAWCAALMRT